MLEIETRETGGTSSARALRRTGKIPGVLYGNGREALSFAVESRHLREALSRGRRPPRVLEVKVPGAEHAVHAIIKDMQLHPLRDTLQHFDLLEVRMDRADPGHRVDRLHGRGRGRQDLRRHPRAERARAHDRGAAGRPARARRARHLRARHRRLDQALGPARAIPASPTSAIPTRCSRASRSPRARRPRRRLRRPRRWRPPRPPRRAPRRARQSPRARATASPRTRSSSLLPLPQARRTPVDLLVAGLGNPGSRYAEHTSQPRLPGRGRAGRALARAGRAREARRRAAARCGSRTARRSRCCARSGS